MKCKTIEEYKKTEKEVGRLRVENQLPQVLLDNRGEVLPVLGVATYCEDDEDGDQLRLQDVIDGELCMFVTKEHFAKLADWASDIGFYTPKKGAVE